MIIKRINEFPAVTDDLSDDDIILVMNDPSGSQITKHLSVSQLISFVNGTSVYDAGVVTGTVAIDFDINKQIQALTLNGTTITLTKGAGWPNSAISRDVVLHINVTVPTLINWNIITEWYAQPPSLTLSLGYYIVLLRSVGSTTVQGHYVGNRTT
jgi:hypothetical protein